MKPEIAELLKFLLAFSPNACLCAYIEEIRPYYAKLSEEDTSKIRKALHLIPHKHVYRHTEGKSVCNAIDMICVYPDELVWAIMKATLE